VTRLEEFLKSRKIKPIALARESGYSRQHLLRLRHGSMEPTRACIAAIVSAASKLSGSTVRPEELFILSLEDTGLTVQQQQLSAKAANAQKRRLIHAHKIVRKLEADKVPFAEWTNVLAPSEALVSALLHRGRELTFEKPRAAEQVLRVAVALAAKLPRGEVSSLSLHGRAHTGRGNALANLSDYPAAFAAFADAEDVLTQSPYCVRELAQVWYSRGRTLMRRTDYDDAIRWARRARAVFEAIPDDRLSALARVLEGAVLYETGNPAEAERLLRAAVDPLERANDRAGVAFAWLDIGRCNIDLGDPASARVWLQKARAAFAKLGARSEVLRAQWSLGWLRALHEDRAGGLEELYRTRREFEELSMPAEAALAGLDIVEVLLLDDAEGAASQAMRVCRTILDSFDSRGETANARRAITCLRDALQRDGVGPEQVREVRKFLKRWSVDPHITWDPPGGSHA
jgi:tetratricopeptide (TPR) repeat protein